jgi:hypothetical protein
MTTIRSFEDQDWAAVRRIVKPVFRAGETYAFAPDISEAEARQVWIETPLATFVALGEAMFWKIANQNPKIYLGI